MIPPRIFTEISQAYQNEKTKWLAETEHIQSEFAAERRKFLEKEKKRNTEGEEIQVSITAL